MAATAFWASFYPVGRLILKGGAADLDPFWLTWLRFAFAAVTFTVLLAATGHGARLRQALREDWRQLFFLAFIGNVAEGLMVFIALRYTTAARASLLANASPIFTVVIAYFALRERAGFIRLWGMILGFTGILMAMTIQSGGDIFSGGANFLPGDLLALGSGICWAGYTVGGARISRKYGGVTAATLTLALAVIQLLPICYWQNPNVNLTGLSWQTWAGIFYLGVFANGLANGLWYAALKYLPPGELGAFGYVSASLSMLLSIFFLDESISAGFLLAMALVMGGVTCMLGAAPQGAPQPRRSMLSWFRRSAPRRRADLD